MTPIQKEIERKQSKVNPTAVGIVSMLVALLLFAAIGLFWLPTNPLMGLFTNGSTLPATIAPPTEDWTGPVYADYSDKTVDEIKSSFSGKVEIDADGESSEEVKSGHVISQQPAAGSPMMVDPTEAVLYVVLSNGPAKTTLPEVKDLSYTSAAEDLTGSGFVVLQEVEYSDSVAEGKVIDYVDHKAGEALDTGSEVTLRVSLGKEKKSSN